MQIDVAAISLCERHKKAALRPLVLHLVAMPVHDTDHFHLGRRTIAGRLRVSNALTDRIPSGNSFFAISSSMIATRGDCLVLRLGLVKSRPRRRRTPIASK